MTLSSELAKKLKDAGFPDSQFWFDGGERFFDEEGHPAPTLEELIEACGDDFAMLERGKTHYGQGDVKWIASANSETVFQEASTPTEAVARLWLALHKS